MVVSPPVFVAAHEAPHKNLLTLLNSSNQILTNLCAFFGCRATCALLCLHVRGGVLCVLFLSWVFFCIAVSALHCAFAVVSSYFVFLRCTAIPLICVLFGCPLSVVCAAHPLQNQRVKIIADVKDLFERQDDLQLQIINTSASIDLFKKRRKSTVDLEKSLRDANEALCKLLRSPAHRRTECGQDFQLQLQALLVAELEALQHTLPLGVIVIVLVLGLEYRVPAGRAVVAGQEIFHVCGMTNR